MKKLRIMEYPLDMLTETNKFYLKAVKAIERYDNGVKTNEVIGYRYTLVDEDFDIFNVKVEQKKTIITNQELQQNDEKILVALEEATYKYYLKGDTYKTLEISISAKSIEII